jgi:hypothetical protein
MALNMSSYYLQSLKFQQFVTTHNIDRNSTYYIFKSEELNLDCFGASLYPEFEYLKMITYMHWKRGCITYYF